MQGLHWKTYSPVCHLEPLLGHSYSFSPLQTSQKTWRMWGSLTQLNDVSYYAHDQETHTDGLADAEELASVGCRLLSAYITDTQHCASHCGAQFAACSGLSRMLPWLLACANLLCHTAVPLDGAVSESMYGETYACCIV